MHIAAREICGGGASRALAAGVSLTLSPGKTAAFEITGRSSTGMYVGCKERSL